MYLEICPMSSGWVEVHSTRPLVPMIWLGTNGTNRQIVSAELPGVNICSLQKVCPSLHSYQWYNSSTRKASLTNGDHLPMAWLVTVFSRLVYVCVYLTWMESKKENKVVFKLVRIADTRQSGYTYSFAFQFYKKSNKDEFSKFAHETPVSYFIGNFRDNYFRLHYLEETLSLPWNRGYLSAM